MVRHRGRAGRRLLHRDLPQLEHPRRRPLSGELARSGGHRHDGEFSLDGQRFIGINGGPQFTFSEAVSFQIECATQDEVDFYWERLTDGGEESQCGWLKDRYGLSWQVVPSGMEAVFTDPDPERAQRAMQAMLGMSKLDMAALRAAADGVPAA